MATVNRSFTLEEETFRKLEAYASFECINKSRAVDKILSRFLNVEAKEILADTPYTPPPPPPPRHQLTEEERIREWEWRKDMVERGDFGTHFAEEDPIVDLPPEVPCIYLTPDGLPRDFRLFPGEVRLKDARIRKADGTIVGPSYPPEPGEERKEETYEEWLKRTSEPQATKKKSEEDIEYDQAIADSIKEAFGG